MSTLNSLAEKRAVEATKLQAFPINIPEIKRTVTQVLSQFGKSLIFSEYTAHDISHIDDMLQTVEWLIADDTKQTLSSGEWLMIVLSIYFHDMGLIVTEHEFKNRDKSDFLEFCDKKLFSEGAGADYKAKVDSLPSERRERFLYEEFVRSNHARRVRSWIEGRPGSELGFAENLTEEIERLLKPLGIEFRRDLALVCESHNLDDIENITKYRVWHPYGNSDSETVNLQFCAIILRTVDLIQITHQRTPATIYRLINPSDPISQLEWVKQLAVKRIRPKVAVDADGKKPSPDTIEVFATFSEPDGFFGLTSYLKYARDQINSSYEIMEKSKKHSVRPYLFPWRYIDDDNVSVTDFIKEPFGFEIDQGKVLDLLTGHTLYNDSNIVVRELAQNAIDAVRLQSDMKRLVSEEFGKVTISWNSTAAELSVLDNGTGMTQDIIERHLLRVGSSRYQDPKFREQNPNFSPISRFGIGVLSSFMVADSVEIVTVSEDEEHARQISLRSVHGKYLIRLLDKRQSTEARQIGPHGTLFRLTFRASAKELDVEKTVRSFIRFPRCRVFVVIDGAPPQQVGYASPKAALESYLAQMPVKPWGNNALRVEQRDVDGLSLAYALVHSTHFKEWEFVQFSDRGDPTGVTDLPSAECIEGIAVEFSAPGFRDQRILAISNAIGATAPKTNVARSSVEITEETEAAAGKIYKILFDAAAEEVKRLREGEFFSLTWAVQELPFILSPLIGRSDAIQFPRAHRAALANLPMFLVESADGSRSQLSLNDLENKSVFWTVESRLIQSVELFIREAKAEVSARQLLLASQGTTSRLPDGLILANLHGADVVKDVIERNFSISHFVGNVSERRIDLKWSQGQDRWVSFATLLIGLNRRAGRDLIPVLQYFNHRSRVQHRRFVDILAPIRDVIAEGLGGYYACRLHGSIYLLPNTSLASLCARQAANAGGSLFEVVRLLLLLDTSTRLGAYALDNSNVLDVERVFKDMDGLIPEHILNFKADFQLALEADRASLRIFDPLSWSQRNQSEIEMESDW